MNKRKTIKEKALHEMKLAETFLEDCKQDDAISSLQINKAIQNLNQASKKSVRISNNQIEEVKKLLSLFGLPFIQGKIKKSS